MNHTSDFKLEVIIYNAELVHYCFPIPETSQSRQSYILDLQFTGLRTWNSVESLFPSYLDESIHFGSTLVDFRIYLLSLEYAKASFTCFGVEHLGVLRCVLSESHCLEPAACFREVLFQKLGRA